MPCLTSPACSSSPPRSSSSASPSPSSASARWPSTREALADAIGLAAGPGDHSVGAPDLHAQDVVAVLELAPGGGGKPLPDGHPAVLHELVREHAVDVLPEAVLGVLDRLLAEGAGHDRSEHDAADAENNPLMAANRRSSVTLRPGGRSCSCLSAGSGGRFTSPQSSCGPANPLRRGRTRAVRDAGRAHAARY